MAVTLAEITLALDVIKDRFAHVLGPHAWGAIEQARWAAIASKTDHDERVKQKDRKEYPVGPWGFSIRPDQPLTFQETEIDGLKLRVDVFGSYYWESESEQPHELQTVIRVWCTNGVAFRPEWDADSLHARIQANAGRVILRIHFDLANPGQQGPRDHAQIGGHQYGDELCWFPEQLSLPRLMHAPMDLVLAVELISANFFPETYEKIRKEPAWRKAVRDSQGHLLERYFRDCTDAVAGGKSVLDERWNVKWS